MFLLYLIVHEVNTLENQDGQEDMIYNDIRESRMVENGGATSSSVYNLPPQFCGVTYPLKMVPQRKIKPTSPQHH